MTPITCLMLGVAAGMAIMGMLWWCDARSYIGMLVRKAQPETRSAFFVGGRPYIVMPEKEYIAWRTVVLKRPGLVGRE